MVLPTTCAGCGRWDTVLCQSCQLINSRSIPISIDSQNDGSLSGVAIGDYCERLRRIVLAAKHDPRRNLSAWLYTAGAQLGSTVSIGNQETPITVIPIPSGLTRRWRGMLVTPILAKGVASGLRRTGVEARCQRVLAMKLSARTQSGKNREQRRRRRNVFRLRQTPTSRTCLLVDDVITTGTTIREAVSILEREGYGVIAVAAVGIVRRSPRLT